MDQKDPYNTQTDRLDHVVFLTLFHPRRIVCVCVLLILLSSACVQDLKGPGRQVLGADFYFFLLSSFHLTSLVEYLSWINAPYTHTPDTPAVSAATSSPFFFHFYWRKNCVGPGWRCEYLKASSRKSKEKKYTKMGSSRESLGGMGWEFCWRITHGSSP